MQNGRQQTRVPKNQLLKGKKYILTPSHAGKTDFVGTAYYQVTWARGVGELVRVFLEWV